MQATRRMSIYACRELTSRYLEPESDDVFMLKNFSKTEESTDTSIESGDSKLVDPVRWYGLLAPQSLRDAQSRFVQGTSI
jgi:hypothetical protein